MDLMRAGTDETNIQRKPKAAIIGWLDSP